MDAARVECTGTAGVDAAVLESATSGEGGGGSGGPVVEKKGPVERTEELERGLRRAYERGLA